MPNTHESIRFLPPFELEIEGKSPEQIYDLVDKYRRLRDNNRDYRRPLNDYRLRISEHAQRLQYEANKQVAVEILNDPGASEDDRKFAKRVVWAVQVNKLFDASFPPKGDMNDKDYDKLRRTIGNRILQEHPMPNGKIENWDLMPIMEAGEV